MDSKHRNLRRLSGTLLLALTLASCVQKQNVRTSDYSKEEPSSSSVHVHDWSNWEYDDKGHRRYCYSYNCDAEEWAEHTFKNEPEIIEEPATDGSKAGTKGYKCTVCDYVKDRTAYTPYIEEDSFRRCLSELDSSTSTVKQTVIDASGKQTEMSLIRRFIVGSSESNDNPDTLVSCVKYGDEEAMYFTEVRYHIVVNGAITDYLNTKYYMYAKNDDGRWCKTKSDDTVNDAYFYTPFRGKMPWYEKTVFEDLSPIYELSQGDLKFDSSKNCYIATAENGEECEFYFNNGTLLKLIYKSSEKTVMLELFIKSDEASNLTVPEHALDMTSYANDETGHWHTCSSCEEEANKEEHDFGDSVLDLNRETPANVKTCKTCGYSVATEYTPGSNGDTILYGYYPQTHLSSRNDPEISKNLNSMEPESNGWYLYKGAYYYKKPGEDVYGENGKYDDGESIEYRYDYWFRCDPIEWKILPSYKLGTGRFKVVSSLALDACKFGDAYNGKEDGHYANDYAFSKIRDWLNDDFFNMAFSLGSSYIQECVVDNTASTTNSSSNEYASLYSTNDMVYLPSYQDYANSKNYYDRFDRKCKTTDYARARHAYYDSDSSSSTYKNALYWTRSPHTYGSTNVSIVNYDGELSYHEVSVRASVRPMTEIKIA